MCKLFTWLLAGVVLFAGAQVAWAAPIYDQVVNLDVQTVGGVTYVGLGAAEDAPANTFWNVTNAAIADMRASDNSTVTGIDFSLANGTAYFVENPLVNALTGDRIYASGTGTFAFSGLDPSRVYDIYIYSSAWSTTYTISGIAEAKSTTGNANGSIPVNPNPPNWIEGADYVVFEGVVPTVGGTLTGTYKANSNLANAGTFAGVQIALRAIPEPTIGILAPLGALLLLARRKHAAI